MSNIDPTKVTGPISSLPGAGHPLPEGGTTCDSHPERPATHRVQGETDSFGSEMIDMCDECWAAYKEEAKKPNIGQCDWCKSREVALRPSRDYEEGMSGPVYYVCSPCITKRDERDRQYMDEHKYDILDEYDDDDYRDDYDESHPGDDAFEQED